jgi:hypothetical protein
MGERANTLTLEKLVAVGGIELDRSPLTEEETLPLPASRRGVNAGVMHGGSASTRLIAAALGTARLQRAQKAHQEAIFYAPS